jgi:hypothetical protein
VTAGEPLGPGDGVTVAFTTLTLYANELVTVDRFAQTPGVDYAYVGASLVFTVAPVLGALIYIRGVTSTSPSTGAVDDGPGGSRALSSLRDMVREESDTENDQHVTDPEIDRYINQSRYRLYDKLIQSFGDDYFTAQAQITTDGQSAQFNLPDGILYGGALPFYKGELVEAIAGGNIPANSPVTLLPFNLREKNRFQRPLSMLAAPGMFPRYRIMGSNPGNIIFTPRPSAGLVVNLWYAPKLPPLVVDTDVADDFSGWLELVVVDAAIKVVGKQERDAGLLVARKRELVAEIEAAAANRNLADPNTVVMTEGDSYHAGGFSGGGSWS